MNMKNDVGDVMLEKLGTLASDEIHIENLTTIVIIL